MKQPPTRNLARDGALALAALLGLAAAVGLVRTRVKNRQATRTDLTEEVRSKRANLAAISVSPEEEAQRANLSRLATEWTALTSSGSQRVKAISAVAKSSGVRITSLKSQDSETSEDERVRLSSHLLSVRGTFQQVATFVDGLQRAEGVIGIDELEIGPADTQDPGLLDASMSASWYCAAPVTRKVGD